MSPLIGLRFCHGWSSPGVIGRWLVDGLWLSFCDGCFLLLCIARWRGPGALFGESAVDCLHADRGWWDRWRTGPGNAVVLVEDLEAAIKPLLRFHEASRVASSGWTWRDVQNRVEQRDCIVLGHSSLILEAED